MYQTQTSTGTVLTQVQIQPGQQHQSLVNPQLIQIQPVTLHPQNQHQGIQVQYQPISTTQVQFQPSSGTPQVTVQAPTVTTKNKRKGSRKPKKGSLAQQQQQIVAAQFQQVQQQQQIQQVVSPIAATRTQAGFLGSPAANATLISAIKSEVKDPETSKVITAANKDLEDAEYGPNPEGELNAGCRKCNVVFGTAVELKVHFGAAHNRQTFECFVCNKLFLQKFAFLAHVERYHSDLGNSFPCQHCDKSYTNQKALETHINEYHKNAHLMCPFCQKTFPQKFSLRRHVLNVHENAGTAEDCKNPFKCLTCGKSYKSQSGLTIHSKSKHQNTQYKCDICQKSFSRASNVARHVDTIHNLCKTFPCKWCGKEFRSTGGRDMHVSAEHKAVRYSCTICGKQFKRKGSLGRHLAGTHGQGHLEMFKCDVCSKEFKQKSHLKTHLKNLHSIVMPTVKDLENSRQPPTMVMPSGSRMGNMQPVSIIQAKDGSRPVVTQMQPISILQPQHIIPQSGQQIAGQPMYMKLDPS